MITRGWVTGSCHSISLLRTEPGTVNVPMNEVRLVAFQSVRQACLVTEGLNSCSAAVIASKNAAILAHIAPQPPSTLNNPDAGDQNMQSKMDQVAALFTRYKTYFEGNHVWIVYAVIGNRIALPDQKAIIDRALHQLDLNYTNCPYTVVPGFYRPSGHGTVVVDARSGTPEVYIDEQRMN